MLSAQEIEAIFAIWQSQNSNPQGELHYDSTFELLVAVILSAQATDISVNKATTKLFAVANTPESLLDLGEEKLKHYIRTIGLFNNKAKHIIEMCTVLLERFQGEVPDNLKELMLLPGVGRKTANVVLQMAFSQPVIAVDTHVFRVSRRLGLSTAKTADKVEQDLMRVVPDAYKLYAHHWLILHGRYVCKARTPLCDQCALKSHCASIKNNCLY